MRDAGDSTKFFPGHFSRRQARRLCADAIDSVRHKALPAMRSNPVRQVAAAARLEPR